MRPATKTPRHKFTRKNPDVKTKPTQKIRSKRNTPAKPPEPTGGVVVKVFTITGKSPILMNNPACMKRTDSGSVGRKKIPTPEKEAADKVYQLTAGKDKGQLFIPAMAFRSAMLTACTGKKIGSRAAKTPMSAAVFTVEDNCPLIHAKTGKPITTYAIHTCRAVVQKQGILRSRPEISDWSCRLPLEIDQDFVTCAQVLQLLNDAGKYPGVMDWRIENKGKHGRFSVVME